MKNTKYINNLINEYNNANGSNINDINSKEFIEWINHRRLQADTYAYLLKHMDVFFDDMICAEIGKGRYDSVAISHDTSIITPYVDKFMTINEERIVIESDFAVIGSVPTLVEYKDENKSAIKKINEVNPTKFKIYMTQNPYNKNYINNWEDLHNVGDTAIIFGVYGNNYDKDKNNKIKLLEELKNKMLDFYIEDSETIKDQYYHIIATNIPAKTRKMAKFK